MTKSLKIELLILPCLDALALGVAFFLAFWLRLDSGLIYYSTEIDAGSYYRIFLLSLPLFWILFYGCHLYDSQEIFYGTAEYVHVIKGITFAVLSVIVVSFFLRPQSLSRSWLLLFWIFGMVSVGLARFTIRRIVRPLFRSGRRSERTLVIGGSEEAKSIAETLRETGRLEIVGFLDDFMPVGEKISGDLMVKGSPDDYERIARKEGVSKLILVPGAVSWETYRDISFEATKCQGLEVLVAPRLSGLFSGNLRVSYLGYVPMLRFQPGYGGGLDKFVKAFLDFSLGLTFFILSLPLMVLISLMLLLKKGRPIFECQAVLGLQERPFCSYRFHTASDEGNRRCFHDKTLKSDLPVLKDGKLSVSRILFATGLDKLPQLINVLRGQMSLVGPRPIYESETRLYDIWLQNLVTVKPGMIGPWAMSGVNDLQQEIATTLSYIHTWTPSKDLQIICFALFYLLQNRIAVRTKEAPTEA